MTSNNLSTLLRKSVIALLPHNAILKRRLSDRIVFRGINKAGFGGRGVFLEGLDIEPELAFLPRFLESDSVFIDIGANSGVYTVMAASYATNGTVIAYEPFPEMSGYLLENARYNNLTNIRVRTFGISNVTGSKKFFLNQGRPNSFSFSRNVDNAGAIELFTQTLDDALGMERLQRVDYIKIDAEGEEQKIIEGAAGVIKQYRPIIQTEALFGSIDAIAGYLGFSIGDSVNTIYIPADSHKVRLARELGWKEVT